MHRDLPSGVEQRLLERLLLARRFEFVIFRKVEQEVGSCIRKLTVIASIDGDNGADLIRTRIGNPESPVRSHRESDDAKLLARHFRQSMQLYKGGDRDTSRQWTDRYRAPR